MRTLPLLLATSLAALGCGDNLGAPDAHLHIDAPAEGLTGSDAGSGSATPDASEFTTAIDIPAGADGLFWDGSAGSGTLYLTRSDTDKLETYTDAAGLTDADALPAAANGETAVSFGGLTRLSTGVTLVDSVGLGSDGAVFSVPANLGTASRLTGLTLTRRRFGIAAAPDGTLYTAYFTGNKTAATGGVAILTDVATVGTETAIATEDGDGNKLQALIGLVATNTALFVSDTAQNKIFKITVPGHVVTTFASPTTVDQLLLMPNGDLLTSGGDTIWRIGATTGTPTALFTHLTDGEGLAYDSVGKRLFVVDHGASTDQLKIFPLAN